MQALLDDDAEMRLAQLNPKKGKSAARYEGERPRLLSLSRVSRQTAWVRVVLRRKKGGALSGYKMATRARQFLQLGGSKVRPRAATFFFFGSF